MENNYIVYTYIDVHAIIENIPIPTLFKSEYNPAPLFGREERKTWQSMAQQ